MINKDLVPKDKIGALKYGYWFLTRGVHFNFFTPTSLSSGLFLGKEIKPSIIVIFKSILLYLFNIRSFEKLLELFKMFRRLVYKK